MHFNYICTEDTCEEVYRKGGEVIQMVGEYMGVVADEWRQSDGVINGE